jgi:hypothetical protein
MHFSRIFRLSVLPSFSQGGGDADGDIEAQGM